MRAAIERAAAQLRRDLAGNARLRLGVWIIAALALAFAVLAQIERLADARAEYAAQARQLAAVDAVLARRDWPDLLAREREANALLAERFWRADSEGLAQAQLQEALAGIAERISLRNPRIRASLGEPVPGLPGVCRVQAELNTEYPRGADLRLVHALSTFEKKLVAERLLLGRQISRVSATVSAYFLAADGKSPCAADASA